MTLIVHTMTLFVHIMISFVHTMSSFVHTIHFLLPMLLPPSFRHSNSLPQHDPLRHAHGSHSTPNRTYGRETSQQKHLAHRSSSTLDARTRISTQDDTRCSASHTRTRTHTHTRARARAHMQADSQFQLAHTKQQTTLSPYPTC
jgi:hypothetical protein